VEICRLLQGNRGVMFCVFSFLLLEYGANVCLYVDHGAKRQLLYFSFQICIFFLCMHQILYHIPNEFDAGSCKYKYYVHV